MVGEVCDRVLVMYAGRIVEDLPAADLATGARHPYTRALVAAVPDMDTDLDRPLAIIPGRPVDPADVPAGLRVRRPLPARRRSAAATEDPPLVADARRSPGRLLARRRAAAARGRGPSPARARRCEAR